MNLFIHIAKNTRTAISRTLMRLQCQRERTVFLKSAEAYSRSNRLKFSTFDTKKGPR